MNYQIMLDDLIKKIDPAITNKEPKKVLLHSCCAPCSSYVIEYLSQYFQLTVFYYNPNITDLKEYQIRAKEQQKLIRSIKTIYPVEYLEGIYQPNDFYQTCKGFEKEKEGGERCKRCFELRLRKTAEIAKEKNLDYFSTTLTISPLKNSELLNEIGQNLATIYGVSYLPSDFKKRNGYKRSVDLSKEYDLYRQDYCGCIYSKIQRENEIEERLRKELSSDSL